MRRQDEQIISHHQEEAKFNEVAFFGGENKALPAYQEHFDYYLDYEKKMLMWGGVFGQKNIIIRVFDSGSLFQQDAVTDFFHLLKISDVEPIQKNTSTGFESTKINLLMSQAGLNKYYRGLLKIKNDTNKKFLPSRNEAEKFYNKYRKSNQRLNKKYRINDRPHIFHEDFSRYPEKSQDLWDEKSANHAISSIINNLNQIHPLMLVKIAIKLFIQSIKK